MIQENKAHALDGGIVPSYCTSLACRQRCMILSRNALYTHEVHGETALDERPL
jgi:hypothetical protein